MRVMAFLGNNVIVINYIFDGVTMKPLSPCAKPECIGKNKIKCCETCSELDAYQQHLMAIEDPYSPPGIDYTDDMRAEVITPSKMNFHY